MGPLRDELLVIKDYFLGPTSSGRERPQVSPAQATDVEMEALAQTWSEHCKHKIFNAVIEYREDGRTRRSTASSRPTSQARPTP